MKTSSEGLFVASPEQGSLGAVLFVEMFFFDPAGAPLVAPFPDQRPALEQVFLQVQVVEAGRLVTLRRDLHVDAHGSWI